MHTMEYYSALKWKISYHNYKTLSEARQSQNTSTDSIYIRYLK